MRLSFIAMCEITARSLIINIRLLLGASDWDYHLPDLSFFGFLIFYLRKWKGGKQKNGCRY